MRSKDYEYNYSDEEYEITEERKEQLISKIKEQIRKDSIAHYQILNIGKNDNEYEYIYEWLYDNNIEIRGINRNS